MKSRRVVAGLAVSVFVSTAVATAALSPTNAAQGGPHLLVASNNEPIEVPDGGNTASTTSIANGGGVVTDVDLRLNGVTAGNGDDLDIELVGPTGVTVILMSDACGTIDIENRQLVFDDEAADPMPDSASCPPGPYKPTDHTDTADQWPWPPTPGATLATFDGTNPNGVWVLRVVDDNDEDDVNEIAGGFTLMITTAPYSILLPPAGAEGAGSPYPFQFVVSGRLGKVADVDLVLGGVTHQRPDDISALLVAPNGAKALVLNDSCGSTDVVELTWTMDDEAAIEILDGGPCPSGSYRPKVHDVMQDMPAPAPAGPYVAPLSTFDGIDPNGTWSLYVSDDGAAEHGFLSADPQLVIGLTDATPPDTLLSGKKPGNTTKTKAKLKFTSTEAGSTFQCKVDAKKYRPCASPLRLKNLKPGKHKVLIVATDVAGNQEATPLKITWKVLKE